MKYFYAIGAFFFGYYVFGSIALSLGAIKIFAYIFGAVIGLVLGYLYYTYPKMNK